jgi:hypothetical protein
MAMANTGESERDILARLEADRLQMLLQAADTKTKHLRRRETQGRDRAGRKANVDLNARREERGRTARAGYG